MDYLANHDVHHDGKAFGPNERVEFSGDDRERFVRDGLGPIAELLAAQAIREDRAPRLGVALADQSTDQLAATAAVLGLGIGAADGRDALIFAIDGARARLAGAAIENPVRTSDGAIIGFGDRASAPIAAGFQVGGGLPPVAGDRATRVPVIGDEEAARLAGETRPNLPDTGETAPRPIPELDPGLERAKLAEIAAEHGVAFASNATAARLRELIDAARVERAAVIAPPPVA